MDILTQVLLGAALAQSGARQNETRIATWIGFAAGLLADADVFIQSANDPLLTIEYHRHFTHSLFFVPFGALLAALLLWPFVRNKLKFKRLYLFALLGYSLSGVLDTCTSYGTYILWPLVDERIAWHVISIVDPIFTLSLLTAVIFAFRKRLGKIAMAGLAVAVLYMSLGWLQLERAEIMARDLIVKRGHDAARVLVKPTIGNLLLWRSVYQYEHQYYVDAIRLGVTSPSRIYTGGTIPILNPEQDLAKVESHSMLYKDIERFTKFSDGWVAIHPQRTDILMDVRYSNLPNSLKPLWGIEMDIDQPNQHAKYSFYRDMSKLNRQQFVDMVLGREITVAKLTTQETAQ